MYHYFRIINKYAKANGVDPKQIKNFNQPKGVGGAIQLQEVKMELAERLIAALI
ncbi:MAG: hypothetical protein GQ574_09490 [Crocinitomix sp.]|nr:hypothetical protein [Crocinitomix sp.]